MDCSARPGNSTAQRKLSRTSRKCRKLKVTIACAPPLIAVSRTMSSDGSGKLGRQRNASRTGLATAARSFSTSSTSPLCNPKAASCSSRVRTAAYSRKSGTETSNANRSSNALSKSWREAPLLLRNAATITSVSRKYSAVIMISHAISLFKCAGAEPYNRNSTRARSAMAGIWLTEATSMPYRSSVVSAKPMAGSLLSKPSSTTANRLGVAFSAFANPSRKS